MSLVLNVKYASDYIAFYKNRVLRIYPAYFFGLVLAYFLFTFFANSHHNPSKVYSLLLEKEQSITLLFILLSNLIIFGSDILKNLYLFEENGLITTFMGATSEGVIAGHNFYILPQNWTLAAELTFYLICPYVTKLSNIRLVFLTIFIFVACDFISNYKFSSEVPLNRDGIFVFSFRYFLLGMLAHRLIYTNLTIISSKILYCISLISIFILILLGIYSYKIVSLGYLSELQLYLIYSILIPIIFNFTKNLKLDDKIGQYSYPIYIFHYPVAKSYHLWDNPDLDLGLTVGITISLSYLYLQFIEPQCEKFKSSV